MLQLVVKRLSAIVPVIVLVSVLVFLMGRLIPGDAAFALAGENASPERIQEIRTSLGLDEPLVTQYTAWVTSAGRGDLGESLFTQQSVTDAIVSRLPVTLSVAIGALVLAILMGIPAGIVSGVWRGRPVDRSVTAFSSLSMALPPYFIGLLLVLALAIWFPILPSIGYSPLSDGLVEWAKHIFLPSLALSFVPAAVLARQLRSSLTDTLHSDFVRMAQAKGLRPPAVVLKHALRNALVPTVTVLGAQAALLLGGTVIIEQVFALPGVGQLAVGAVLRRDLPVIQGVVIVMAVLVMAINLLIDVSYGWLNPKTRAT